MESTVAQVVGCPEFKLHLLTKKKKKDRKPLETLNRGLAQTWHHLPFYKNHFSSPYKGCFGNFVENKPMRREWVKRCPRVAENITESITEQQK
jgi:hypothetical protein